jgi:hypothetical protein
MSVSYLFCMPVSLYACELRSPATAFGRAEEFFLSFVSGVETPGYCRGFLRNRNAP